MIDTQTVLSTALATVLITSGIIIYLLYREVRQLKKRSDLMLSLLEDNQRLRDSLKELAEENHQLQATICSHPHPAPPPPPAFSDPNCQ